MVMYHGTTGLMAARIARRGLIARPPNRHYEAHEDAEIASLSGTYFTNQLEVAVGYAYKAAIAFESPGYCAVVMAKVPLNDAVPDEDVVTSAMHQAERETRDPNAFVRAFHWNLVQDRPIPIRADLIGKVRDAYANLEQADDEAGYMKNSQHYRRALDRITRAYAAMVFDTHPVYLGGNHTVRLPRGLPTQSIISITSYEIVWDEDDGGSADYPQVADVSAVSGEPLTLDQLQAAVDGLYQRDFF